MGLTEKEEVGGGIGGSAFLIILGVIIVFCCWRKARGEYVVRTSLSIIFFIDATTTLTRTHRAFGIRLMRRRGQTSGGGLEMAVIL